MGLKCSEDYKTIKVLCFCEHHLLSQHFGVCLLYLTCTFHKAEMVVEMVDASTDDDEEFHRRPGFFSGTFEKIPVDPDVITSSSFIFHFHIKGIVDHYSPDRFDFFLVDQLWEACKKKHQTDVLFKVGDRSFFAHKFILAARSPVLAAMFHADMIESRTGTVEIDDVDPDIFRQFLRFVYTGQVDGPLGKDLKRVADKYDVKTLLALCKAETTKVPTEAAVSAAAAAEAPHVTQLVSLAGLLLQFEPSKWTTNEFNK